MSEFTIRSESVDVEQIMKQIRQRIYWYPEGNQ